MPHHPSSETDRIKILITRHWPAEVERLVAGRHDVTISDTDTPMKHAELVDARREFDVICPILTDHLSADLLQQENRRVRMLANYGAGVDHIDLDACQAAGIVVTNTPDVLTDATAELTIQLMLMVARRAGEGERESARGLGADGGRRIFWEHPSRVGLSVLSGSGGSAGARPRWRTV